MHVEVLGEGEPEVSVVGALHGDEPSGARAVRELAAAAPVVERPVALVVANEEALERDRRYVDVDLNRTFPGDPDADTHEGRLAARLADVVEGTEMLALHSTQSHPDPFAIAHELGPFTESVVPQLPVDALVLAGPPSAGRIFEVEPDAIEVECGHQRSEAATANARAVTRAFLGATGVLPEEALEARTDIPVFELGEAVPKAPAEGYDVFAENFRPVEPGERFAAVDGDPVVANEPFHPVLMSAEGYEDVFGYRSKRVGTLSSTED